MRRLRKLWRKLPPWVELSFIAIAAVTFIALGSAVVWATLVPLPAINNFESRKIAESTKIFDRTGNVVLYDVHGSIRRTSVPLEEMSPYLQKATIAIEDDTFYEHNGFRPAAFLRALLVNIQTGSFSQGGSTITQQVVKNALLTQRKTIGRKIEEIILALRLERVYTKDQILQTYLNEAPYGGTIYGAEEASNYFFGVSAKDLDLAQAAYMAALPQRPTYYSPYGNNREALDRRKDLVLARMRELDFITEDEYQSALSIQVRFRDVLEAGIKAPHFVFFVREYLEEKYGADEVANAGFRVISTLDYDLQKMAEEVVAEDVPIMMQNFNASNAGVVAIDPKSGQILAMVGSRGYFDEGIDGAVNVTTSYQQPGSAFKPFIYATALERGYTPETVVFDIKTQFSSACSPQDVNNSTPPCYAPTSFDDTFKGPVTFRAALAQSLNIPAVKALYLAGIDNALRMAERVGITTLTDAANYGLSLVLGGGDVTLLELTGAYSVFANDGVKNPPTAILRIEDKNGNVIESFEEKSERVMDQEVARKINDILSDNVARTPEFGANSPLYFPGYTVAAKTGTTNDYWDVWIMGYTPSIAIGAWAGNNDNTPMIRRIAAFIIAPMWHKIMEYGIEKYPSDSFLPPAPEDLSSLPPVLRGEWNSNPAEGVHEILYWVNKDNPRSGMPANHNDTQFPYWEYPVSVWTGQASASAGSAGGFRIMTPFMGSVIPALSPTILSAEHPEPEEVSRVSYYLNGRFVGASNLPPYAVAFIPDMRGPSELRAVAETEDGEVIANTFFTVQ